MQHLQIGHVLHCHCPFPKQSLKQPPIQTYLPDLPDTTGVEMTVILWDSDILC